MTAVSRLSVLSLSILIATIVCVPHMLHAQSASTDLEATIRAQLLSDPRTSSLSEAQLTAMVQLLSQKAEEQGLTAHDLTWRPVSPTASSESQSPEVSCAGNFTCVMSEAFGFLGPDTTIPFALGAASMALIWLLAEMIHRHKYPHLAR